MTAFVLSLFRERRVAASDEIAMTMKTLLLGMMACMVAGADSLIWIPDGPLSVQQMVMFGLICGTIGTVAGCAYWDIPNAKTLARHAIANLGISALGGASLSSAIAWSFNLQPTFLLVAPTAGILGIGGSYLLEQLLPMVARKLAERAEKAADTVLGLDKKENNG